MSVKSVRVWPFNSLPILSLAESKTADHEWPCDEAAAYYLAAMIDGEGTVGLTRARQSGHVNGALINIYNTDIDLLERSASACRKLGIRFKVIARRKSARASWKQGYWLLVTNMESVAIISRRVPVASAEKKRRIEAFMERSWIAKRPSKDSFAAAWEASGRRSTRAGRMLGLSDTTVRKWARIYGIYP